VCGQQKEKEIKKESQKEPKESKFFNKTCHVRGTTDAKKKYLQSHGEEGNENNYTYV
jgi:hypothetical protein